jgi:hypothetical protein
MTGGQGDMWSTGGAAVGDISCPSSMQPFSLIWDPNTNVITAATANGKPAAAEEHLTK